VGPAGGHILLPVEGDAAVAAVAGLYGDLRGIHKRCCHGRNLLFAQVCFSVRVSGEVKQVQPHVLAEAAAHLPVPHLEEELQGGADDSGGEVAGVDLSGDRIADGDMEMEIGRPVLPAYVPHQGGDLEIPLVAPGGVLLLYGAEDADGHVVGGAQG